MATNDDTTRLDDLKARVSALGYRLVTNSGHEDARGNAYTGLYILNPEADELDIVTAGSAEDDLNEITGWCEKREKNVRELRASVDRQAAEHEADAREVDDRPAITVLTGAHCDAIYGINGIADAFMNELQCHNSINLACALRELSRRLQSGLGSLAPDVTKQIEQATGMQVRQ